MAKCTQCKLILASVPGSSLILRLQGPEFAAKAGWRRQFDNLFKEKITISCTVGRTDLAH